MRNQLIYDLPTRIFHWLFAGLFILAFAITKIIDSDSPTFTYHMLAGLTLGYIVILRLCWGLIGSKYARFTSFSLKPKDLFAYFAGILSGSKKIWIGHNPASSWASIIMFVLSLGLGITGYLMTGGGNKETFEDIHELMANAFFIIAILHVMGIVLHTIRHRDGIGFSMIDGKKQGIASNETISGSNLVVGLLFLALTLLFVMNLIRNYDTKTQTLQFFGTSLQLGENESDEEGENSQNGNDINGDSSGDSKGAKDDSDDDGDDD